MGEVLEESLAIAVLFILGVIGSLFHTTIVVLKFKLKSMKQNFYTFVASLAVIDLITLQIFMFWCIPCIIFKIDMDSYVRSNIPGFVMYVCWHLTEHFLLVISGSRFIAVFYPTMFRSIDEKYVRSILFVILLVSIVTTLPLLFPPCSFSFDFNLYVYHLGADDCSWYFDKIISLVYDILFVQVISMGFNWATFYKVNKWS